MQNKKNNNFKISDSQKIQIILVIIVLLSLVTVIIAGKSGLTKIYSLHKEKKSLKKEIEKLAVEKEDLKRKCESLENDPWYIEKYARENYGMSRDGETIYKIAK